MSALVRPDLAHEWHLSPQQAMEVQRSLRSCVEVEDRLPAHIQTVCGVDTSSNRFSSNLFAAAVLLRFEDMSSIGVGQAMVAATFPYVPGLLAFREMPAILQAMEQLPAKPDLIIADGHGLAHQRRFGIACHLGVLLDIPSIGCAKSVLTGVASAPGPNYGDVAPMLANGELLGYAVRTRQRANPVYVSVGNRVSAGTAVRLVLECTREHRLPEPTRLAHQAANQLRRGEPPQM